MIPKIIHMSWKTKDIVHSQDELIQRGLHNLIALNPEWQLDISTDEEVDEYLQTVLGSDYYLVKDIGIVPQTDLWRLFKLYTEGGLYIDIDRLCNISLSDILDENTKCVLPTCEDNDFSHDFMLSAPSNPIFACTIDLYLNRRKEGYTNVYMLGPQTYMHAVTYTLCGKMIDTNPGADVFDDIRAIISNTVFLKTYRESPPSDTVMYQGDVTVDEWESMKRKFYASSGVKHWTGEW